MKLNIQSFLDVEPLKTIQANFSRLCDGDRRMGFLPLTAAGSLMVDKSFVTAISLRKKDTRSLLVQREESLDDN
jgi:hypothetical protein